jgi:hypothetical protein
VIGLSHASCCKSVVGAKHAVESRRRRCCRRSGGRSTITGGFTDADGGGGEDVAAKMTGTSGAAALHLQTEERADTVQLLISPDVRVELREYKGGRVMWMSGARWNEVNDGRRG